MQSLLSLLGFARPASKPVEPPRWVATPIELDTAPRVAVADLTLDGPPVPGVTATELWRLFDMNEADAEHRFAHRPLYVSGAVDRVTREGAHYVVELSVSGAFFSTVRCRVGDGNRFNVEQLRRGDLVMILGRRVFREYGRLLVDEILVVEDDLTALPRLPLQ